MSWVLVTGAARRIGRAIALELAKQGWDLILHYHRSADEAASLAGEIEKLGRQVVLAEIDLAKAEHVSKLIPSLTETLGPLAALVNNASLFERDADDPTGALHKAINADAPQILSEALYRQIPADSTGAIVNMLDGVPPEKGMESYVRSKLMLRDDTLQNARKFAPRVRVNAIAPGPVFTNVRQSSQHFQKLVAKTPLGIAVPADDIARAAAFLLSTPAVTGEILHIDGGQHLLHRMP